MTAHSILTHRDTGEIITDTRDKLIFEGDVVLPVRRPPPLSDLASSVSTVVIFLVATGEASGQDYVLHEALRDGVTGFHCYRIDLVPNFPAIESYNLDKNHRIYEMLGNNAIYVGFVETKVS